MINAVYFFGLTIFFILYSVSSQNYAPGVPPQQYQPHNNQPLHQQYQQQAQHQPMTQGYMQAPLQQQQQPQHQPPPHQQQQQYPPVAVHQPHHDHQQILNAANIAQEREHIQEHLHVPIDTSKMTETELQFHYFKMHDSDNNNKLDGCELIKSLIHWHDNEKNTTFYDDKTLEDLINRVLTTTDFNNDGFIDYPEFKKGEEEAKTN